MLRQLVIALVVGGGFGARSVFAQALELEDSRATSSVRVHLVGQELSRRELAEIIGVSSDFDFTFDQVRKFSPRDWYGVSAPVDRQMHVWVVTPDAGQVDLYFADPGSNRFLIRHLRLSEGLDEMDREALAQAIRWSLLALAQGSVDSLTRAQAHGLLEETNESSRLLPEVASTQSEPPRSVNDWDAQNEQVPERALGSKWTGAALVGYQGVLHSTAIGLMHGPLARVSLQRGNSARSLRLGLVGFFAIPASERRQELQLRLSYLHVRGDAQIMVFSAGGRFGAGLSLGGGIENVWLSAEASPDAWSVGARRSELVFVASLGGEFSFLLRKGWRLGVSVGADFSLKPLKLEVERDGQRELFLATYPVRPRLGLGLTFD